MPKRRRSHRWTKNRGSSNKKPKIKIESKDGSESQNVKGGIILDDQKKTNEIPHSEKEVSQNEDKSVNDSKADFEADPVSVRRTIDGNNENASTEALKKEHHIAEAADIDSVRSENALPATQTNEDDTSSNVKNAEGSFDPRWKNGPSSTSGNVLTSLKEYLSLRLPPPVMKNVMLFVESLCLAFHSYHTHLQVSELRPTDHLSTYCKDQDVGKESICSNILDDYKTLLEFIEMLENGTIFGSIRAKRMKAEEIQQELETIVKICQEHFDVIKEFLHQVDAKASEIKQSGHEDVED